MKTETNKFINIRKIKKFIGIDVATKLPQIHTVTIHTVKQLLFYKLLGEIKVLKKCLNRKVKRRLLNRIGVSCKVSDTANKDIEKFIQNVSYFGKEEEK